MASFMKIGVIALLCSICFSTAVLAIDSSLSCQYQTENKASVTEQTLQSLDGRLLKENFLSVSDLRYRNNATPCWFEFDIKNNEAYEIRAIARFSITTTNETETTVFPLNKFVEIPAYNTEKISYRFENAIKCGIVSDSLTFDYRNSEQTTVITRAVQKDVWECKLCNGQVCKNDGDACITNKECGGGICGENVCVSACPAGQALCGDSCVGVGNTSYGEPYACDFQCKTGRGKNNVCIDCESDNDCTVGVCNIEQNKCVEQYGGAYDCRIAGKDYVACEQSGTCVLPSSKENGEGYSCVSECRSGYGVGGVCMITPIKKFAYSALILIAVALAAAVSYLYVRNGRLSEEVASQEKHIEHLVKDRVKIVKERFEREASELESKHKREQKETQGKIQAIKEEYGVKSKELKEKYEQAEKKKNLAIEEADKASVKAESLKKENEALHEILKIEQNELRSKLLEEHRINAELEEKTKKQAEQINNSETELKRVRPSPWLGAGVFQWCPPPHYYPCYANKRGKYYETTHKYIHIDQAKKIFKRFKEFFDEHYKGYSIESRDKWTKLCVHHINDDKLDYRMENLAILTYAQHEKIRHSAIFDRESGLQEIRRLVNEGAIPKPPYIYDL